MKLCKDCQNRGKKQKCQLYTSMSNKAETCKDFKPRKQTNEDWIRAMSTDELAEFLTIAGNFVCMPTDECRKNLCAHGECVKTKECAMRWLHSEK